VSNRCENNLGVKWEVKKLDVKWV